MSVIHISKRENPYVQIDKRVLEDPRLTWRSKGILAYLLSKPSGWKVNVKDIWNNGAEGRNAVQDCLVELQKIGYAKLITISGEQGKLMGSQWQINEEPIGGFPVNAERPKTGSPKNRKSGYRVHSNNESLSEISNNNEGDRTPPAPESQNLKEEEKESGLVAPGRAENPETVKAEIPPSKKVAPKKVSPGEVCPDCSGRGNNTTGGHCWNCSGTGEVNPNNTQFGVTAIASPSDLPGVTIIEPVPPLKRANTILEAEQKIIEWAAFGGIETVRYRHNMAKRKFNDEDLQTLVAHYVSVYASTNAGSKASLLRDPVAHFEAGLFKFLKNESAFERNYTPKEGGPTRNGNLPAQNLTSKMRQL